MILFCNPTCMYIQVMRGEFGDCKRSFSWLGQKIKDRFAPLER